MSTNDETGGSSAEPTKTGRKADGTFAPGNTQNPTGRPLGSRNSATLMAEKLMQAGMDEIIKTVVDSAKAGDMTAARLVLERIVPIRKGRPVALDLPPTNTADGVSAAVEATVQAMTSAEISPEEAAIVTTVLEARRKAIETTDLDARIKALEEAASGGRR